MILPTKYMDLTSSVILVAATILKELKGVPAISLEELDEVVQTRLGVMSRFNFIPALNMLYVTGCLDYDVEDDLIITISQNAVEHTL